jgi:outer membrane protein assembly complex protein YaeT
MPGSRTAFLFLVVAVAFSVGACREEGDIQIASLDFTGVQQVDKGALENALQTREGSWLPWGRKRYFDRRAFEADLKRIEAFYRDRGFPDARVRSFDVELNETQDKVSITLDIVEGEPIRVAAIDLVGFDVLSDGQQETLRDQLPLQPEAPLDRQLALASRERALNTLRDEGYPYAAVTLDDDEVAPKQHRLVLRAEPGVLAHFGIVDIHGPQTVGEEVIRRQLTFEPGDRFTRTDMRDTQRKLYGLELFEFANVQALEEPVLQNPEVPVRITVAEGKHRRVTTGIGYGTEEHARARIRWEHLNLFGGAEKFGAEGKWSSLDRGVRLDYREPFFFARHLSLNLDGQAWQVAEPLYSTNQVGARVTLRRQVVPEQFLSVSLASEFQRSSITRQALEDFTIRDELIALGLDPRGNVTEGTLTAVAVNFNRNTTNHPIDARRGYMVDARVEKAGEWLRGTFDFWSTTAEGRHYVSIGDRVTVANRLRIGSTSVADDLDENVPFYRRYFLGGASSLRGWGRFEVSPLSGFGFPIGGLSMLEGSTEVRLALFGNFGAVAFLDFGNVWARAWDIDASDLRYSVGPGLRYMTPIGPARFDVGYQLTPIEGLLVNGEPQKRRFRMHFSIGQAF